MIAKENMEKVLVVRLKRTDHTALKLKCREKDVSISKVLRMACKEVLENDTLSTTR